LSKLHLLKAEALGAKLDSIKTQVKENLTVSGIHDEESKERDVNVNVLDSLCMELRRQLDSIKRPRAAITLTSQSTNPDFYLGIDTTPKYTYSAKTIKEIQNMVCPDVKKDTTYHQDIEIQGKHFDNPIHIIASSIGGHASLKVDAKPLVIPFIKEENQVNAEPADMPTFTGKLLRGSGLLLIGVVIGFILGKVLKFGVNL
jgi:hypothetical protein